MSRFHWDHTKFFAPELIHSLTCQLARFPVGEEVDVFYLIDEGKFAAFVAETHNLDVKARDYPCMEEIEITDEDIEVQVVSVLRDFIEYKDIPVGGYHSAPIKWKSYSVMEIENTEYLTPVNQEKLSLDLTPLVLRQNSKSDLMGLHMKIEYLPENEAAIVEILKRYIK